MAHHFASRLRTHRQKSGLSQRELAYILGYTSTGQVIQHEYARSALPFLMALAYEAVFRIPVSQLFPGFYETVVHGIETRLTEFEQTLQSKSVKGRGMRRTAHKLEWLSARRNGIEI